MNAFIYQSALLCEPCGKQMATRLCDAGVHNGEDSDIYPQGPYSDGGGESDRPEHCDICGVFLENPLTPDGMLYVQQARDSKVSEMWREFYGVDCVDRGQVAA